jgi:hypothetical protein
MRPQVGLGLDDAANAPGAIRVHMHEPMSEQFAGDDPGVAIVKGTRQFEHNRV